MANPRGLGGAAPPKNKERKPPSLPPQGNGFPARPQACSQESSKAQARSAPSLTRRRYVGPGRRRRAVRGPAPRRLGRDQRLLPDGRPLRLPGLRRGPDRGDAAADALRRASGRRGGEPRAADEGRWPLRRRRRARARRRRGSSARAPQPRRVGRDPDRAPPELARYLVEKGSVSVDGISLTVTRSWTAPSRSRSSPTRCR